MSVLATRAVLLSASGEVVRGVSPHSTANALPLPLLAAAFSLFVFPLRALSVAIPLGAEWVDLGLRHAAADRTLMLFSAWSGLTHGALGFFALWAAVKLFERRREAPRLVVTVLGFNALTGTGELIIFRLAREQLTELTALNQVSLVGAPVMIFVMALAVAARSKTLRTTFVR